MRVCPCADGANDVIFRTDEACVWGLNSISDPQDLELTATIAAKKRE